MESENHRQSEAAARQKRFAVVLCGDDQLAQRLVERLTMIGGSAPDNRTSPAAHEFYQLKKLYEIWMGEAQKTPGIPLIFQRGQENAAIQKGLDPSIARVMGGLPSLHRALLLLIYGESFSYAATAQLLNITIEELMMALAAARQEISGQGQEDTILASAHSAAPDEEAVHDPAQ